MKTMLAGLACAGLMLSAWAQDEKKDAKKDEDKIGKAKAPEIVLKSASELAKKKGYHASEEVTLPQMPGGGGGQGATAPKFEGVVLKDVAAMKGSAEVWAKSTLTLIKNTQGQYVGPETLQGQEATIAGSFRNPAVVLLEIARFAATSAFTNDEAVDGVDCKIAQTSADPKTTEEQIKSTMDRVAKQFAGRNGGGGGGGPMGGGFGNMANLVDKKNSSSDYRVWIGKSDLLPYKIEWVLTIAIDKSKIPGGFGQGLPDKMEAKTEIMISKYDEKLEVDFPKEIKAKFGVK